MKWSISIVGVIVIAGLAAFGIWIRKSDVQFVNLGEAQSRLLSAGLYCTPDKADGSLASGFLLSRGPMKWTTASALCKIGNMGPEWQGKVWVTIQSPLFKFQTMPDNAGLRNWGKVFAFGDEALLRELDDLSL